MNISMEIVKLDIEKNYKILEFIPGHYKSTGKHASLMKNPIWKVVDDEKEKFLIYCEKETVCTLCPESYNLVLNFEKDRNKKISWYKTSDGYILGTLSKNIKLYIHQIITNCFGNGQGTMNFSVDHIDKDPLNNTLANLRVASREQQEMNKKCSVIPTSVLNTMTNEERNEHTNRFKRKRQETACGLPEGIVHGMMPKYISLRKRILKDGLSFGFVIECHPKMNGDRWWGTTSNKIPILEKLNEAIDTLRNIENSIPIEKKEKKLPTSISIVISREKAHLSFDKRVGNDAFNKKMVLPDNYDIDEQLIKFNKVIIEKYGLDMALDGIEIINDEINNDYKLPNNVYIQLIAEKPVLVYQKSENKKRLSVKYKLPESYDIKNEVSHLNGLVIKKYGIEYSFIII